MNIAIFTDFFLPSLGGVQTSIVNQKRALQAAGHTVTVFAPCYEGQNPYEEIDGIVRLPSSMVFQFDGHPSFIAWPWAARRVASILKAKKIDIVHAETEFSVGLLGLKVAKKLGIATVYTSHTLLWKQVKLIHRRPALLTILAVGYYCLYMRRYLPKVEPGSAPDWIERLWLRSVMDVTLLVDAVITPSHHLAKKLTHARRPRAITVIPNTTDFDKAPPEPLPATPTLLWVARFSPEKRPVEFMEAIKLASRRTDRQFKVILCGSGPMKERCRHLASGMTNVTFKAVTNYADMPRLYNRASALVVTSYGFENQPMTIAEALARRRGVIFCDPALRPDGLADGAGWLTGPTPGEMADGLVTIIENPDKLAMMSKMSEVAARRFSEQQYVSAIEELYQSLALRTKPARITI